MTNKSKHNHLKSITHETLDEYTIRGYNNFIPIFDQFDEILRRYNNISK